MTLGNYFPILLSNCFLPKAIKIGNGNLFDHDNNNLPQTNPCYPTLVQPNNRKTILGKNYLLRETVVGLKVPAYSEQYRLKSCPSQ
jgi:hypothetical protein